MNNSYLDSFSESFIDDHLERIEKRCFFLMCGKIFNEPTISIELSVNAFDDPALKQKVVLTLKVNQIIIEYCSEIFKNMT